jgi:predicted enzyme related to lactoylglutathione lyase
VSIIPQLDAVFVHVTDIARAIDWYSKLLDLPTGDTAHEGRIYDLPVAGETGIILDSHPKPAPPAGTGPRIMFDATDLESALAQARTLSPSVTEPEDIGSAVVFYIEDPDANLICVKVRKT